MIELFIERAQQLNKASAILTLGNLYRCDNKKGTEGIPFRELDHEGL